MIVRVSGISKQFGTTIAIRDLSVSFPEHGIVAIMGPSGCGKTTLLQILAGLQRADRGTVQCRPSSIAYVFQEPRLLPWRTAVENIRLARSSSAPKPSRTAEEWLNAMGLGDCTTRYPEELSGGMRQRVAIARALYCDSDLLLMDEPFKGLDEATRMQVMELVRSEQSAPHKLTLIVTHDKAEAAFLADYLLTFSASPASSYTMEQISHG